MCEICKTGSQNKKLYRNLYIQLHVIYLYITTNFKLNVTFFNNDII